MMTDNRQGNDDVTWRDFSARLGYTFGRCIIRAQCRRLIGRKGTQRSRVVGLVLVRRRVCPTICHNVALVPGKGD